MLTRLANGVARLMRTVFGARRDFRDLMAKTPDQLEDIGLSFVEIDRLARRRIA